MEEENMSIDEMLEKLNKENIKKLELNAKDLGSIWSLVGVDKEQQLSRANQAWSWIINLSNDLVKEERGFYEELKERVKNYEQKIIELSKELIVPLKIEVEGTLIEKEEILRQELDKLSKLKHDRIKEYQELYSMELKYCKMLGMPQHSISSTTGVPSEKDLFELHQQVNMLQAEKEQRLTKFYSLKKELTTIWEVTELAPETTFEKEILSKSACQSLTKDCLNHLGQSLTNTMNRKAELEHAKRDLVGKLSMLWDRLNIDEAERQIFLSRHNDCCVSSVNGIKNEIARCEEIKRQNLKQYVDGLRKELTELWENCYVSDSDKVFSSFDVADVNEDVLKTCESEVAKWRQYYKDVQHIVENIQKRNKLWELMIVFENKANDPKRFKNRRGNLLQEERERKKLQNDLPKLENEIFEAIGEYEFEHEKPFLYQGIDFRVFITSQWEERYQQKENKKIIKQNIRKQQIENEITLGATPAKRPLPSTPKSAPSTLFKSKLGMPSIYQTPKCTLSRSLPKSVAQIKVNKKTPLKTNVVGDNKKVLQEKKDNAITESCKQLEDTTYSYFEANLNKPSRKVHRSSVLSSRKIVGSRTSNLSKRKSGNKSARSSVSRRACTSKKLVIPARGKLGIPFLI